MDALTTENKLMLSHLYNLKCLNETERSEQIKDLLKKGWSYRKLSKLLNIPLTTLLGWGNPEKKKNYYEKDITLTNIQKEIEKKYCLKERPGKMNDDGEIFRSIATLNFKLRTVLNILKDIKKVDNDVALKLFKEIKTEIHRLNGVE